MNLNVHVHVDATVHVARKMYIHVSIHCIFKTRVLNYERSTVFYTITHCNCACVHVITRADDSHTITITINSYINIAI